MHHKQFYFTARYTSCAQRYNNTVALMFGHAMIWVAFSQYSTIMPAYLCNRIVGAYNLLPNQLPAGTNLIKQLDLVVSGRDNEVYLTEIDGNNQVPQQGQQPVRAGNGAGGGNGGGGGVALAVGGRGANTGLLEAIVVRLATIQRFLAEVKEQHAQDCAFSTCQYQGIAAGIWRIHRQPDQVLLNVAQSLSPTPHSLFELWTKWTVGIGGRKPAKTSQQLSVDEKNSNTLVARSCGN
jgi:hypothetical protein